MIDSATLRSLIREVIEEEVKAFKAGRPASPRQITTAAVPPISDTASMPANIASDGDLAAFARQVLILAEQPALRAAILAGRHPFRLASPSPAGTTTTQQTTPAPAGRVHRVERGVVTESLLLKLPGDVARLILGPGVTVTPLARDKAKSRNISIERARQ
jgi:hypothetical protein